MNNLQGVGKGNIVEGGETKRNPIVQFVSNLFQWQKYSYVEFTKVREVGL